MAIEIVNSASALCGFSMQPAYVGANAFTSAPAVLAAINDELAGDGLTIAGSDLGWSGFTSAFTGTLSGTVQILNQSGQELDDTDLQAQFTDAAAAENMQVTQFGVQKVFQPKDGTGTNSGSATAGTVTTGAGAAADAAAAAKTPVHNCGDTSWGFIDDPIQYIVCLTSKGLMGVGLLAIGLLIGIILIVGMERRPTPV